MADDPGPAAKTFGRRLEKWAKDAAQLGSQMASSRGLVPTPEQTAVRRYQRSTTGEVTLPHPLVSPSRYAALTQRCRELNKQATLMWLLVPAILVLGAVSGPVAVQAGIWALLLPLIALLMHRIKSVRRMNAERHLPLEGGLADAWRDWVAARDKIDSLDGAAQARAALGANEARMQSLVLMLARAAADPTHQDTSEHAASREWVFRSAAKATALAAAEHEIEAATQRQIGASELQFAPDGDLDEIDQALDNAREIARGVEDPPALR